MPAKALRPLAGAIGENAVPPISISPVILKYSLSNERFCALAASDNLSISAREEIKYGLASVPSPEKITG